MPSTLLRTKLFAPPVRMDLVARPRLRERLSAGLQGSLTLVAAPAGFGKTTAIADWLEQEALTYAWYSLDAADNDPVTFWHYVIAALQTVDEELGREALAILQAPTPPPVETVPTMLINDVVIWTSRQETSPPLLLVLDDYHTIEHEDIHRGLAFFIEHLPPQLHLVLTTRSDPPLPLARLRSRHLLSELRAQDLRFTEDEATVFLNEKMGLALAPEDIRLLGARTEGWAASLHLAALSLSRRPDDSHAFIQSFHGNHRFIVDYLLDEVFAQQTPEVQRFLLDTSILDRMCEPLCRAVMGATGSSAEVLPALERMGLFVIPLDDQRTWYRYHHLFADLLRSRVRQERSDGIAPLYQRASRWFKAEGLVDEAIHYALEGNDYEHAEALITQHWPTLVGHGQFGMLSRWIERLPIEVVRESVSLCFCQAYRLRLTGRTAEAMPWLQAVKEGMAMRKERGEAVPEGYEGHMALHEAWLAIGNGDLARYEALSWQAREAFHDLLFMRSVAESNLSAARLARGNLQAAVREGLASWQHGFETGNAYAGLHGLSFGVEALIVQGRLREAARRSKEAVEAIRRSETRSGWPVRGLVLTRWGEVLTEWNELEEARHVLDEAIQAARQVGVRIVMMMGLVERAYLSIVQHALDEAGAFLDEAVELVEQKGLLAPWQGRVRLMRVRLWLARGEVDRALAWAEEAEHRDPAQAGWHVDTDLVRARIYLAAGLPEFAGRLLDQVAEAAEAAGGQRWLLEAHVLRARLAHQRNETVEARRILQHALALAEPERYVRLFVNEGPTMAELLTQLLSQPEALNHALARYASTLLATLNQELEQSPAGLDEPLSDRELEVLRLIAGGLTNQDVADRLFVTVGTVKKHTHNIYQKLGVGRRTEALRRAQDLHLI